MSIYHEFCKILTTSEKRKLLLMLIPLIVGMLLEMASLGMVPPAIYIMIKPNLLQSYAQSYPFLNVFENVPHSTFVIFGLLALVFVYFIKTTFLTMLIWKQSKLIFEIKQSLSQRLFRGYLNQPWIFHLQRNSSQLITNAIHEVNLFTSVTLVAMFTVFTESLVFLGVLIVLLVYQPLGTLLVLGILGIIGFLFQKIARSHILNWGKMRQHHDGLRAHYIQEGLGAIKDIKLLGHEDYFLNSFNTHNQGSSHVNQRMETIQQIPRYWIELLAIIALAVLVSVMVSQGRSIEFIIPTVGLFAAASFRILPSVNRLLSGIQTIVYSLPVINTLYQEFKILDRTPVPVRTHLLNFKHQITVEHVHFKYETAKNQSLKDINMHIPFGSSVGFIGTSGAGKSTLADIILGLITPDSGHVKVDGVDIQTNIRGWQDQIGFVPQTIYLSDNTLRANIAFGIPHDKIDEKALQKAVKAAQLTDFLNSLPDGLDTKIGERGVRLSGGQRQRIGIARALYHDPAVIVFDESTNSLDNKTEQEVMKSIDALRGKKTLLIIAHRLSTVENCNYVFKFEKGEIVNYGDFKSVTEEKTVGLKKKIYDKKTLKKPSSQPPIS